MILNKISSEASEPKKESMFIVMMPAYHNIQVPIDIVGFDDPVHGLGTFKQQDYITKHQVIILQRP